VRVLCITGVRRGISLPWTSPAARACSPLCGRPRCCAALSHTHARAALLSPGCLSHDQSLYIVLVLCFVQRICSACRYATHSARIVGEFVLTGQTGREKPAPRTIPTRRVWLLSQAGESTARLGKQRARSPSPAPARKKKDCEWATQRPAECLKNDKFYKNEEYTIILIWFKLNYIIL
jgi:hypothetical protein